MKKKTLVKKNKEETQTEVKMKELEVTLENLDLKNIDTQCLLVGLFQDKKSLEPAVKKIDAEVGGLISSALKDDFFKGEKGELKTLYVEKLQLAIILLGFGEESKLKIEGFSDTVASTFRALRDSNYKRIGVALETLPINKFNDEVGVEKVTLGAVMGLYSFNKYRTKDLDKIKSVEEIKLLSGNSSKFKSIVEESIIIGDAVNKTRSLVNTPPNDANPEYMAKYCEDMAKDVKIKCTILEENDMKKQNLNCVLAVAQGSSNKPKFVILEYKGSSKDPIILVGKGVTFDTGGLNIKPFPYMNNMKDDKAGACAVVHVIEAAAKLKLPVNVIAITPYVENMPSSTAYRPDDVVKSYSGLTVEIKNTDAEGRMILADALSYALQYNPEAIIDVATLTGAAKIVLGPYGTPVLGTDDHLISRLKNASVKSLDKVWEMPLWKEYDEELKSEIADVSHISSEGNAGTTMGAAFLKNFVEDAKWAHLDIGSTIMTKSDKGMNPKGITGVPVRLLIELLKGWK